MILFTEKRDKSEYVPGNHEETASRIKFITTTVECVTTDNRDGREALIVVDTTLLIPYSTTYNNCNNIAQLILTTSTSKPADATVTSFYNKTAVL